jgi:hypothetical protein
MLVLVDSQMLYKSNLLGEDLGKSFKRMVQEHLFKH